MKKLTKKVLPVVLAGAMVAGLCMPTMAATTDPWSIADAEVKELTITLDNNGTKTDIDVTCYTDEYLDKTSHLTDAQYKNALVNVWVPETATENSPILYMVNNGQWLANTYSADKLVDGETYTVGDTGKSTFAAMAAAEGYIVVDAGLRSRKEGEKSPVTVADAKAVIRYLRYNEIGNTDRIFITGTSGGGALSVAIASDGNSADFYQELNDMGAAGMANSTTSTINDDVFGTVAFCPITDLGHADGSYEYTYAIARAELYENGYTEESSNEVLSETSRTISPILATYWASYVNKLGVAGTDNVFTKEDGASGTIREVTIDLLMAGLQEGLDEFGYDAFVAEIEKRDVPLKGKDVYVGGTPNAEDWKTNWITFSEDKKTIESIDIDKYLYYVALGQVLKPGIAFTNQGVYNIMFNENNLYGLEGEACGYNLKEVYVESQMCAAEIANGKTADEAWAEYWASHEATIEKQMRMTDSIEYLVDKNDGDSASYWYVRHGSVDRDTSFANQTLLYLAMESDETIADVDFKYEFGQGHTGEYGLEEAMAYIKASVAEADAKDAANQPEQPTTPTTPTTPGKAPQTGEANYAALLGIVVAFGAVAIVGTRRRELH